MRLPHIPDLRFNAILFVLVGFWIFNSFVDIGSAVEQSLFPVRINQHIENVEYDKQNHYFCWDYVNLKVREKTAFTTIVRLKDQSSSDGYLFTPFKRSSLSPWNLSNDIRPAQLIQPFCIYIPPGFKPRVPFRIEQEFIYPGFFGLWNISTKVPPIVYSERDDQYEHQNP